MNTGPARFLLVEDEDVDAERVERIFARERLTNPLIRACDGHAAYEFVSRECDPPPSPLVILLDINMPRMNGFEFLDALRARDTHTYISVVVLSTSDNPRDLEIARSFHVCAYLQKPFRFQDLINALEVAGIGDCLATQEPS